MKGSLLQDTVVALQGLAEFAILTYSKDVSMSITIDDTASVHNVTINSDNMDVLQILEVLAFVFTLIANMQFEERAIEW